MVSIQIISGTDRPKSNALRVAAYLQKKYREQKASADIMNLRHFPLAATEGGKYREDTPEVDRYVQPLLEADGLVFVCPEYNGGYPGILKIFIDYLPYPASLNKKPVCLVGESNSPFGGQRAVEQLQQVIGYQNAHILPERVFIPKVKNNFEAETGIKNDYQQNRLEEQINHFIPFVEQFKNSG